MRTYICGPMSGIEALNFPAFHAEARRLRALGHTVVNPAEINPDPAMGWAQCMRRDMRAQAPRGLLIGQRLRALAPDVAIVDNVLPSPGVRPLLRDRHLYPVLAVGLCAFHGGNGTPGGWA